MRAPFDPGRYVRLNKSRSWTRCVDAQHVVLEYMAPGGRAGALPTCRTKSAPDACSAAAMEGGGLSHSIEAATFERGFFFFQAEDGIRDLIVTGVQTCALPI